MTPQPLLSEYTPHWLTIARSYLGVRETPGPSTTPTMRKWAAALTGWWRNYFTDDAQPWCALYVNACLTEAGIKGTGSLRARDFATWGASIGLPPALGAILVFDRPGGAHVGFYVGESAEAYRVLGGNQGDAVSEIWISKARLVRDGVRWPANRLVARRGVVLANNGQPLSVNEA